MSGMKEQIRADLTAAMKAREELTVATLRMALAALTNEEVAGASARELSDADVVRVLAREVKKRAEAAEVYDAASRIDLADRERAESAVLQQYLPSQLSDAELADVVANAVAALGPDAGMKQMGQAIKAVSEQAAGRADGRRIAAAVRAALAGR